MSKFKVGDKVRIKGDWYPNQMYGELLTIPQMTAYKEDIDVITRIVDDDVYTLSKIPYCWAECLLEPVPKTDTYSEIFGISKTIIKCKTANSEECNEQHSEDDISQIGRELYPEEKEYFDKMTNYEKFDNTLKYFTKRLLTDVFKLETDLNKNKEKIDMEERTIYASSAYYAKDYHCINLNDDKIYLAFSIGKKTYTKQEVAKIFKSFEEGRLFPDITDYKYNPDTATTTISWSDNTETTVTAETPETADQYQGFVTAVAKKAMGNTSRFNNQYYKWAVKKPIKDAENEAKRIAEEEEHKRIESKRKAKKEKWLIHKEAIRIKREYEERLRTEKAKKLANEKYGVPIDDSEK
jgi:hypothetical protein